MNFAAPFSLPLWESFLTFRPMSSLAGRFLRVACATAAFLGTVVILRHAFPPEIGEVSRKLDFFAAHPVDTLFVGSSRVYHGVSPQVFDAAMAAGGRPTHSFNLGVNGMMLPESLHVVRALLARRPAPLRRIFLEMTAFRGVPETLDHVRARDVYWRDMQALRFAWKQAKLELELNRGKKSPRWGDAWRDFGNGAMLFARNECNAGRFAAAPIFGSQRAAGDPLGPAADGFEPVDHVMTASERAQLDRALLDLREGRCTPQPNDVLNRGGYTEMRDLLKERGIELILFTTPMTTRDFGAKLQQPEGTELLAFDDPQAHPELFLPGNRFDYDHLNGQGAQLFTRELAAAYLAMKKK